MLRRGQEYRQGSIINRSFYRIPGLAKLSKLYLQLLRMLRQQQQQHVAQWCSFNILLVEEMEEWYGTIGKRILDVY
ncbi:MAG TPA: hypothetical protein DCE41_28980 [Cytophagales bacterium]|nr:hypothetical protein [Cytophagales bacterium]